MLVGWNKCSRGAPQYCSLKQSTSIAYEASQTTPPPFEGRGDNSNNWVRNINIPTSAYQDLTKIPRKMVSSSKDDAAFPRLIACLVVCVYGGWSGIRINAALHRLRLGNITTLVWSDNKTMPDLYTHVGPCVHFSPSRTQVCHNLQLPALIWKGSKVKGRGAPCFSTMPSIHLHGAASPSFSQENMHSTSTNLLQYTLGKQLQQHSMLTKGETQWSSAHLWPPIAAFLFFFWLV